jgi:hypothetical protein
MSMRTMRMQAQAEVQAEREAERQAARAARDAAAREAAVGLPALVGKSEKQVAFGLTNRHLKLQTGRDLLDADRDAIVELWRKALTKRLPTGDAATAAIDAAVASVAAAGQDLLADAEEETDAGWWIGVELRQMQHDVMRDAAIAAIERLVADSLMDRSQAPVYRLLWSLKKPRLCWPRLRLVRVITETAPRRHAKGRR